MKKYITVTFPIEIRVECEDEETAKDYANSAMLEAEAELEKNGLFNHDSDVLFAGLVWDLNNPKFEFEEEPKCADCSRSYGPHAKCRCGKD